MSEKHEIQKDYLEPQAQLEKSRENICSEKKIMDAKLGLSEPQTR